VREVAAISTIPIALLVKAAAVAEPVGNIRTITTGHQATAYVVGVISAIAAIKVALLVVAFEITLIVANIIDGTGTSSRRTAHVV
jgi:hypothetical protein